MATLTSSPFLAVLFSHSKYSFLLQETTPLKKENKICNQRNVQFLLPSGRGCFFPASILKLILPPLISFCFCCCCCCSAASAFSCLYKTNPHFTLLLPCWVICCCRKMHHGLIGFFIISLGILTTFVHSKTNSQDVSALNVMFTSLNSPSQLSGWKSSGGDPCGDSWEGITCSGSAVTEIRLSDLELTGSLGYLLSNLKSVTYFDMSKNNLNNDIPYQLPPNLAYLDLSNNGFSGTVPYSISQMTDLKYLNLGHNQIKGQLTDMFQKLPKLKTLDLSHNSLSGSLPNSLAKLSGLNTLYLQNNRFTSSINVLAGLPLNKLNVENNKFTGWVPAELEDIDSIETGGNSWSSGPAPPPPPGAKPLSAKHKDHGKDGNGKNESESFDSINIKTLQKSPSIGYKPPPSDFTQSLNDNEFASRLNSKRSTSIHAVPYSLADLQTATSNFATGRLIGEGSIGRVYKAKYPDGKVLAVKKIDSSLFQEGQPEFSEIISRISKVHHPNIAELVGYCSEQGHNMLVYEYLRNGSLHEFLHMSDDFSKPLTWNTRVRIALGTARAVEYLHEICSPSFIHKNIKSPNILLDLELNPRLSDYGLANFHHRTSQNLGAGYNAPECTKPSAYTMKSDIYSFGVVMLELLTGRMPFDLTKPTSEQCLVRWATPQLHDIDALERMVDPALRGLYPPKSLSRFADIIALCVQTEAEFRPPMSEVVEALVRLVQRSSMNVRDDLAESRRTEDSEY